MWLVYKEWEIKCKFSTRWISTFCTFVHFLPSVDIICVFRKTAWPNDFLQLEHVLALTPLWVIVRVYRVQSWANNTWQWSQVYIPPFPQYWGREKACNDGLEHFFCINLPGGVRACLDGLEHFFSTCVRLTEGRECLERFGQWPLE